MGPRVLAGPREVVEVDFLQLFPKLEGGKLFPRLGVWGPRGKLSALSRLFPFSALVKRLGIAFPL